MSKGTGARKEEKKKKSTKTIKEKRADKKAKKKTWVTTLRASVVILNYSWNPVCIKKGLWIIQLKNEFRFPRSGMRIEGGRIGAVDIILFLSFNVLFWIAVEKDCRDKYWIAPLVWSANKAFDSLPNSVSSYFCTFPYPFVFQSFLLSFYTFLTDFKISWVGVRRLSDLHYSIFYHLTIEIWMSS